MAMEKDMILSIIVPTVGRINELRDLLESISNMDFNRRFEVIIVDQNDDDLLQNVIEEFQELLPLIHKKVSFKGLSKAKNFGARLANGKWLSFPDDDCKILKDTYLTGLDVAIQTSSDVVFGKCIDSYGKDSVMKFKKKPYTLSIETMEGGFVEATAIAKKEVWELFQFDEKMGAGCFYGAEEGYDWVYRILKDSNYKLSYTPSLNFFHPQVIQTKGDSKSLKRVFSYRCGFGFLCSKHKLYLKFFKRICLVTTATFLFAFIDRKKAKFYLVELNGLILGWLLKL
ncbi:glycosyltransferase family 2 protein [Desertivirga brevis]|uniref:glycosyltransferase family 2 protein n=1 Tax=Desertivirga brevis TaxID=2810310 RepID=UPI001A965085|nr:glycosyltransferase family 2 protein [Pedobacter sp. SYSU D00873]